MSVQAAPVSANNAGSVGRASRRLGWVRFGKRIVDLLACSTMAHRLIHGPKSGWRQWGCSKRLRFEVPSELGMMRLMRDRAAEFASAMPFASEEVEDIRLAVGEAAVNAFRHGANRNWPRIGMELCRKGDTLRVAVWDRGRGFDPSSLCQTPDCLAEGGRGVFFMRALMDDVTFRFTRPGTRVEMTKSARRPMQLGM